MSGSFDAYHRWLGIPPKEQPPNHYRLLGIVALESDPNVIESAADRQMAHVRTFQTGQHSMLSQTVLNEIAAAKVTLLNAEKKAAYDRTLRARLGPQQGGATPMPPPPRAEATPPSSAADFGHVGVTTTGVSRGAQTYRRRKSLSQQTVLLISLAVAMVAMGAVIYFLSGGNGGPQAADKQRSQVSKQTKREKSAAKRSRSKSSGSKESQGEGRRNTEKASAAAKVDQTDRDRSTDDTPSPRPADSRSSGDDNREPPPRRRSTLADLVGEADKLADGLDRDVLKKRIPIPDLTDQERAAEEIREIFAKEYAAAGKREGKLPLAELLLTQARQTKDNSPARYKMLRESLGLAIDAGDVPVARDALRALEEVYQLDVWQERTKALTQLGHKVRSREMRLAVARSALDLVGPAMREDQYDLAEQLLSTGSAVAGKLSDTRLRSEARELRAHLGKARKAWKRFQPALEAIKTQPEDPAANLGAGKYSCFVKAQWRRGLRHLAKGSDPALKNLAEADLVWPTDPSAQIELGNRWWDLAGSLDAGVEKSGALSRAGYWYRQVVPELKGLEKARVEKRLEEIEDPNSSTTAGKPTLKPGDKLPKGK